jgi:tRNA modification GTPase
VHSIKTIAAIATPLIPSAIGILRVSGPDAKNIANRLFKTKITPENYRKMITANAIQENGELLDQCCFVFYKEPNSYTGEDVLEIFCHGSIYIVKELLQTITAMPDCVLAKNGEFTQRAFLNGKIPLSKAESILDIIESNSEASHKIAINQYTGHVYDSISNCRDLTMNLLQKVEASLEFPDDVGGIDTQAVCRNCSAIIETLAPIINASDYGSIIKKGLKYLIIGEPNVGKSSLLNKLSGESRSIVSETAGTTRDYIDISIEYNGIIMTLIDTAGIRETSSNIEKIGIEKIRNLSETADGYILVTDATSNTPFVWPNFLDQTKPIINVRNKIDKSSNTPNNMLGISCKTGAGLTELKETLVHTFVDPSQYEPSHMLCNLRQITALNTAYRCIKKAQEHLELKTTLDIVCIELRDSIEALSDIMGDSFTEELLDGIFSKFCIGK